MSILETKSSLQLRGSYYNTTDYNTTLLPPSCEAACSIPARQPTRLPNHKTTLLPPAAKQRAPPLRQLQQHLSRAAAYKTIQLQDYIPPYPVRKALDTLFDSSALFSWSFIMVCSNSLAYSLHQ
ncbi:hypothetical protein SAMN05444359_11288 [Neolewinella agarilytica]|uniref:Uncharacterized protein n=1 Tax=Neolewinella agarilytica TaxID=478744 RepID=A0A1H9HB49_9BACT|nr:hypothetical protein SAMN05444359_11288 [Neolewinella agarilytica]